MIMKRPLSYFVFLITYLLFLSSCKKDSFITSSNATISTSTDSVKFDTVFTATGSITQIFKINNLNAQKLSLSQVKLMGGGSSYFKININGIQGPEADNVVINANDSIYVFVTVNINPNDSTLPFIISDSVLINYNGNNRFIQLQAYGQNAHFIDGVRNGNLIIGNVTWTNDLPYVILGGLQVDTGATLTIQPGCRIYSHADAPFLVDGTLITSGTAQQRIIFTGDRLDADYKDLPASWPGVYFRSTSKDNVLTQTVFKNAYQAVVVDSLATNSNPKLIMHQCIIDNAYDIGLWCFGTNVQADNSLISNCGSNVVLNDGGTYNFTNCTVATFGSLYIAHKNPVLQVTNFDPSNNLPNILAANFTNCIFYGDNGSVDDEIVISEKTPNQTVNFDHCIYKVKTDPSFSSFSSSLKNVNPMFDSIDVNRRIYNFHTTYGPGVDSGADTPSFPKDLDDSTRKIGLATDIGCYEKQ